MEELNVLLIGSLGSCGSSREGLHFTPGTPVGWSYWQPFWVTWHQSLQWSEPALPWKPKKRPGLCSFSISGNPRWESSRDGKLRCSEKALEMHLPWQLGSSVKLSLFLWGSFCSLVGTFFFLLSVPLPQGKDLGGLWEGRAALRPWRGNTPAPL